MLRIELKEFLTTYAEFDLYNQEHWAEINKRVEQQLEEKEIAEALVNSKFRTEQKKAQQKQWQKNALLNTIYFLLVVGFIAWITFAQSSFAMGCFVAFFVIRIGLRIWKRW